MEKYRKTLGTGGETEKNLNVHAKKKHKNNLVYSIKKINSRALGECRDGQQCCNDGRCLQSKEMTRG